MIKSSWVPWYKRFLYSASKNLSLTSITGIFGILLINSSTSLEEINSLKSVLLTGTCIRKDLSKTGANI